ncbi:MAG: L-threonylcarbamoyladenylate synthase [Actinomycetota bacterium]|nr:L-threonylcarbamoyladenylate synthase [Actinomycetota bacterium]
MITVAAGDAEAVAVTAGCLERGGIALVPTDTVYGLAVRPGDPAALERVFRAKARPLERDLPVLAANLEQVESLGVDFNETARRLAGRFWPGALTIAFGFAAGPAVKRADRPGWLAERLEVAVRLPDLAFLRSLISRTGVLLVTSANTHGEPTPASARGAAAALLEPVDVVVDGGLLSAQPSTLVNVRTDPPAIERLGALSLDALRAIGVRPCPPAAG